MSLNICAGRYANDVQMVDDCFTWAYKPYTYSPYDNHGWVRFFLSDLTQSAFFPYHLPLPQKITTTIHLPIVPSVWKNWIIYIYKKKKLNKILSI